MNRQLIQAIENNDVKEIERGLSQVGDVKKSSRHGLFLAARKGKKAALIFFIEKKKITINLKDRVGRTALFWASKNNHRDCVEYLLVNGARTSDSILEASHDDIKSLLNYRPGRKCQSIFEECKSGKQDKEKIEYMLFDFEETTDNSSSDDEDVEAFENSLKHLGETNLEMEAEDEWERYDAIIKFNKNKESGSLTYDEHGQLRYVVHRGLHFDPTHFDKAARRKIYKQLRNESETSEHTFSHAMTKQLEMEFRADNSVQEHGLQALMQEQIEGSEACKYTRGYLDRLKKTKNKKPFGQKDKRKTEYARLIQDYVHDYTRTISEGRIKSDFDFRYTFNPLISTSFLTERAFKYASGMLFPQGHRLNPHYRRSTLKAKHPILGVVYTYTFDLAFAFGHCVSVLDWNSQQLVGVKGHYQHECEVIFETYIPKKYMLVATVLKAPDFSLSKDEMPKRFGYNTPKSSKYTRDTKNLREPNVKYHSLRYLYNKNSILNLVLNHVIGIESEYWHRHIEKIILSRKLFPCYPFKNGTLTHLPVKPPHAGKWADLDFPPAPVVKRVRKVKISRTLEQSFDQCSISDSSNKDSLLPTDPYYDSSDVNTCLKASLYRRYRLVRKEDFDFMLQSASNDTSYFKDRTNDKFSFMIALTPSIDLEGELESSVLGGATLNSHRPTFFLNKFDLGEEHESSILVALRRLIKDTSDDDINEELYNKIRTDSTLANSERVRDAILEHEEDESGLTLRENLQTLLNTFEDEKHDVFDELLPYMKSKPGAAVRIIMPTNKNRFHWVTIEIQLLPKKKLNGYRVLIVEHDPYGGGSMDVNLFNNLRVSLCKRLEGFALSFDGKPLTSPYTARQHKDDTVSCGVIMIEDILRAVFGIPLDTFGVYKRNALRLRERHIKRIEDSTILLKTSKNNFLSRHKPTTSSFDSLSTNTKPPSVDDISAFFKRAPSESKGQRTHSKISETTDSRVSNPDSHTETKASSIM